MPTCIRCHLPPKNGRLPRGLCSTCVVATVQDGTYDRIALARIADEVTGERTVNSQGYVMVRTTSGLLREHTMIMQNHLGRLLVKGENVHHINGIRDDNRLENLELWWRPQHAGQRVNDLLDYMVKTHADELRKRLMM